MKKGIDYPAVCVVFFCHDGNGNYLLSKRGKNCRDEHGRWDPGGGGIELGDTAINTLKREIKEEYGAEVIEYLFLGYRDILREDKGRNTHWVSLDFKVLVNRSQVHNHEPHKFDEIAWFTLDNFPDSLHSQLPIALAKYKDIL